MDIHECPYCGHKNYLDEEGLARLSRDADAAMASMERARRRAAFWRGFRRGFGLLGSWRS